MVSPSTAPTETTPTSVAITIAYFTLDRMDAGQEGTTSTL